MRYWVRKNAAVPRRRQLAAQIILDIASYDLERRRKLWSTRELARLLKVNRNTVSAVYRDLAGRGWVESRNGSGVYVRPLADIVSHAWSCAGQQTALGPRDHVLVIEPDAEFRRILVDEIKEATCLPVSGVGAEGYLDPAVLANAVPVVMWYRADQLCAALPPDKPCVLLRLGSARGVLAAQGLPPPDALVAVVSRWPLFLEYAFTILVARGVDPDAISVRDARERGWQRGLGVYEVVFADKVTAAHLPADCRTIVFRAVHDCSLNELRSHVAGLQRKPS